VKSILIHNGNGEVAIIRNGVKRYDEMPHARILTADGELALT
jgi:hypothetical protein